MTIKNKLYLLGFIAFSGILSLLLVATNFASNDQQLSKAQNQVTELEVLLLNLRRNEKDFLLRDNIKYLASFQGNADKFMTLESQLQLILDEFSLTHNQNIEGYLKTYVASFEKLVKEAGQKGISKLAYNEGIKGEVRAGSHAIETEFHSFSDILATEIQSYRNEVVTIKWSISISVIMLIMLFILFITKGITKEMNVLLKTITIISDNNDVSKRVEITGNDELATIGLKFNELLENIETLVLGSQKKSSDLTSNTTVMHGQLKAVIEQFDTQANHTTSMATAVQQMVATIAEISQSTNVAAEGVQQASDNATTGRKVVENTVEKIESLSTTLNHSQDSISSLNQNVDQIGGAVVIIQEIAEQTNLLALNAAIEAARAGEQGRGFAVVADEVRALASRTHQSTEEIANVVTAIQKQMSTVVADINECNEQGQETKAHSQELDESLSQIIMDMGTIQANSESIASAIEEQGVVMNEVSMSIEQLNTISDGNMTAATNCLEEVNSVSQQAQDMDNAVSEFKTSA